ncbi:MAG: glycosyltransferase [Rhodobacteraceae bacterium]|nr:glycosyltransferase [Paracoccaceae bacterium]
MKTELIMSTYNAVRALRLTLLSVTRQDVLPDSVCIADDGSGPETAELIEEMRAAHPELKLRHIWHEDRGFEKWKILNNAVESSEAEFLIFIDGDCLIHPGFLARHIELARRDRYSCGSLIRLTADATAAVTEADVLEGRVFDRQWLGDHGCIDRFTTWLKTSPWPRPVLDVMERIWPVRRTWCGANASAYRDAMLAVNGFDEEMKYGGGDKEFGIRMRNSGVPGRHLRFTAPLVHLDHPRGYKNAEHIAFNRQKISFARSQHKTWTTTGLEKGSSRDRDQ